MSKLIETPNIAQRLHSFLELVVGDKLIATELTREVLTLVADTAGNEPTSEEEPQPTWMRIFSTACDFLARYNYREILVPHMAVVERPAELSDFPLLPMNQRVALAFTKGMGLPYGQVAKIMGCAVGTVKSRVNRGNNFLLLAMVPETAAAPR